MKFKKIRHLLWLSLLFPLLTSGQEPMQLSLMEAIRWSLENNPEVRNARTDVRIAKKKVAETTATGLPQVSAGLSYMNYPDIPTQLIPDFLSPAVYGVLLDEGLVSEMPTGASGRLFEAQFGTTHNATAKAELSQLIFSGSYLVGLQASQAYASLSQSMLSKIRREVREKTANAYYQAMVAQKGIDILDSTEATLRQMALEAQAIYEQGFIEETDAAQIGLLLAEVEASRIQAAHQRDLAIRLLKLHLGLPSSQALMLTDDLNTMISGIQTDILLNQGFDPVHHIDYALVRNQETMQKLNVKLQRSAYLPTVAGFYSYQQMAQRQDFDLFDPDGKWFPTQVFGAQIDIPVFSSGYRRFKVQQAQLELEKSRTTLNQVEQSLSLAAENSRNTLRNAALIHANKEKAMNLASRIYEKTRVRYKSGMASSMDLQQAHNQFLQAEGDYITAILELLLAKSAFDSLFSME